MSHQLNRFIRRTEERVPPQKEVLEIAPSVPAAFSVFISTRSRFGPRNEDSFRLAFALHDARVKPLPPSPLRLYTCRLPTG
jgi:hypothetical protein